MQNGLVIGAGIKRTYLLALAVAILVYLLKEKAWILTDY